MLKRISRIGSCGLILLSLIIANYACVFLDDYSNPDVYIECVQFKHRAHQAKVVTVSREARLHVTLCSNPSTGFSWEPPTIADPTILELRFQQFVGSSKSAAGFEDLLLDTKKSGTTTLSFHYSQPWDGGTKDLWSVTVEVTVSE